MKLAPIPDDREPVPELIERRRKASRRTTAKKAAEKWLPITFNESKAFGVLWFGDPHIDDPGCNWDLLLQHVELAKATPGLYAASIGDTTNNWVGRLIKKYAEQDTTLSDARRLARWFMKDAGIPWALWLMGNHDTWEHGDAILSLISDGAVYLPDWEARLEFRAAGQSWRVHARHDFPGSSIWNKTHGPARAAIQGGAAELYVCGHRHEWAYQSFEMGERGTVAHAVRTRGYKFHDHYAVVCGYPETQSGAAVLTIFDPNASTLAGRVMCFADPVAGAKVLAALRGDKQPKIRKPDKCSTKSKARSPRSSALLDRKAPAKAHAQRSPRKSLAPPLGRSPRR